MLLANSDLISRRPAQLYYSVLPFLPSDTYLACQYPAPRGCISVLVGRENSWSPSLFTLPRGGVPAFAPGGDMFAVGREDGIHIYNTSNGLLNSSIRTLSPMDDYFPRLVAFTEDECDVVVVSSAQSHDKVSYRIEKFDLVKQHGQIYRTTPCDDDYPLQLSEYGSYVAFAEHKNRDTRICIWKTDGSDDISIPLGCAGKIFDLALAGESAHLVAVAMKDITILSIPSGGVQRTLYHEGAEYVCISHDGSFLASWISQGEVRLWSITQGTLLATLETGWNSIVFSRTNRLYVAQSNSGSSTRKVYDVSTLNQVTIKSFPLPSPIVYSVVPVLRMTMSILPAPDESQILIRTWDDIQVWSLRQFTHRDPPRYAILTINFSHDASLFALATESNIEIWDARIGRLSHVIQSQGRSLSSTPVAFSPKGELIVSSSDDGITAVDVRAGVLLPIAYSFPPQGPDLSWRDMECVGISFDSSKLAAINRWYNRAIDEPIRYL